MYKRAVIVLVALLIAMLFVVNCAFMGRAGLWQDAEWNEVKIWTVYTMDFEVDCAVRSRYDGLDCDWDHRRMKDWPK